MVSDKLYGVLKSDANINMICHPSDMIWVLYLKYDICIYGLMLMLSYFNTFYWWQLSPGIIIVITIARIFADKGAKRHTNWQVIAPPAIRYFQLFENHSDAMSFVFNFART